MWFAESTGVAQVEDPAASIGTEDSSIQTSAGEPSAVEFAIASVAVEATTTSTVPEVLATTSVSNEPVIGPTPARVELDPISHSVMESVGPKAFHSSFDDD